MEGLFETKKNSPSVNCLPEDDKKIYREIQQLIGKYLPILREEVQKVEELNEFCQPFREIYRFFCVQNFSGARSLSKKIMDDLWNKLLNSGWKSSPCFSEIFILSTLVACFCDLIYLFTDPSTASVDPINFTQSIDRIIILGKSSPFTIYFLKNIKKFIENPTEDEKKSDLIIPNNFNIPAEFKVHFPITKVTKITKEEFKENYYSINQPVIIKDFNQWEAFDKWRDLNFWRNNFGYRVVPIEIGRLKITGEKNWKETTMNFREFIDGFIAPSLNQCSSNECVPIQQEDTGKIAYLAQHSLFDQIGELENDISVPEYCEVSSPLANHQINEGNRFSHVKMNTWFGTHQTVTSLHYDSYDNFLTQVFGYKYVRLYSPSQSKYLYPAHPAESGEITSQNNISSVDLLQPDATLFPEFSNATFVDCIIAPNEMLYIPNRWWHFVQSLSPSFSLNFWF